MNDIAIRVENLGKRYRIGARQPQANTLLRWLKNLAASPFDYLSDTLRGPSQEEILWALKDVSFEVKKGEVVGIIGRNGAGKSTLLKILSRITEPTEGFAEINGRVGSLLEVGTGFHPQLNGRENIYLNGAILGMRKAELDRKFDEIVEFAEIGRFIDTPVKRYSSGMYVRLAFAVAAHLEPEIFLVDEVLAVGDVQFQRKCLGKMSEVSREGRTVLFVSHNMGAVRSLCESGLWLNQGTVAMQGSAVDVVHFYMSEQDASGSALWLANDHLTQSSNDILAPIRLALLDECGELLSPVVPRTQPIYVEFEFDLYKLDSSLTLGISVFDKEGHLLFRSLHTDGPESQRPHPNPGRNILKMKMPRGFFNEGDYKVVLDGSIHKRRWLYNPHLSDIHVRFAINGGLSESPFWLGKREGLLAPVIEWQLAETPMLERSNHSQANRNPQGST